MLIGFYHCYWLLYCIIFLEGPPLWNLTLGKFGKGVAVRTAADSSSHVALSDPLEEAAMTIVLRYFARPCLPSSPKRQRKVQVLPLICALGELQQISSGRFLSLLDQFWVSLFWVIDSPGNFDRWSGCICFGTLKDRASPCRIWKDVGNRWKSFVLSCCNKECPWLSCHQFSSICIFELRCFRRHLSSRQPVGPLESSILRWMFDDSLSGCSTASSHWSFYILIHLYPVNTSHSKASGLMLTRFEGNHHWVLSKKTSRGKCCSHTRPSWFTDGGLLKVTLNLECGVQDMAGSYCWSVFGKFFATWKMIEVCVIMLKYSFFGKLHLDFLQERHSKPKDAEKSHCRLTFIGTLKAVENAGHRAHQVNECGRRYVYRKCMKMYDYIVHMIESFDKLIKLRNI